jgi:hypothetical protein
VLSDVICMPTNVSILDITHLSTVPQQQPPKRWASDGKCHVPVKHNLHCTDSHGRAQHLTMVSEITGTRSDNWCFWDNLSIPFEFLFSSEGTKDICLSFLSHWMIHWHSILPSQACIQTCYVLCLQKLLLASSNSQGPCLAPIWPSGSDSLSYILDNLKTRAKI